MADEPAVGIGHVVLSVRDVAASADFYASLGLRPCWTGDDITILELRGGTHLLLMKAKDGAGAPAPQRVDLMIAGRTREALQAYRAEVLGRGIELPGIPGESRYGHYLLDLSDPDGNPVVIATSHSALTEALPAGD